jgi:predicted lipid-binding transport protein (Tim44 family)
VQVDLIIYAIVAAGLVFWLKSILGTRHGDERERPNPFTAPPETASSSIPSNETVSLPLPSDRPVLPRNVTLAKEDVEAALMEIAAKDPGFDPARFAQGAQDAFVMIVEAFAEGNRDTLKSLLEPQVYNSFDHALTQREQAGENVKTEIHSIRKVEIMAATMQGNTAYITLRFIAEETCVVRNRDGVILSGDPDRITEMNDIWTFSRVLKNRDPRWFLHETRNGDVEEEHKTPVPTSD